VGKYHDLDKRKALLLKCILLTGLVGAGGSTVYAQVPASIIGGVNDTGGQYAAFVSDSGLVTPIAGLTGSGQIYSVAINPSGNSIIGGANGYGALVSPTGTLTPLSLGLGPADAVFSVSINPNNIGLVGGTTGSGAGFAAFIQPDGTVIPLSGSSLTHPIDISSTALNCTVGFIGGEGNSALLYAAYVMQDGTVIPVQPPPLFGTATVAMNSHDVGIFAGGFGGPTYAALVTPATAGAPLQITPTPFGLINAVAINDAGIGLMGGSSFPMPYAAYVAPDGTATSLSLPLTPGSINGVALNSTGTGIIGGGVSGNFYAALVEPNGSVTPAATGSIPGFINAVAISEAGVGWIGGDTNSGAAYAAIVAPNGAVTVLDTTGSSSINSIDVSGKSLSLCNTQPPNNLPHVITPQTTGPYFGAAYAQFAARKALETFFIETSNCPCTNEFCHVYDEKNCFDEQGHECETAYLGETTHLGMSDDELTASIMWYNGQTRNNKKEENPPERPSKQNSIWLAPFGSYVHLKDHGRLTKFNSQIGGGLLACDHKEGDYRVGAAVGYAFNYIHYGKGLGHGKIQEELGCFYGAYLKKHINVNGALWVGGFQFTNRRQTLSSITSKGKTHGWILAPQVEVASPWSIDQQGHYLIEPFVAFDWFNGWQKHYTETGKSGLNLKVPHWHYSLLQSEAGIRFRERFVYSWGYMRLDETISYVNQAPINLKKRLTTAFVGASSTFPVVVASDKIENLGSLGLMCSFKPRNDAYPYGAFSLQAMANKTYQVYFATVYLGMEF